MRCILRLAKVSAAHVVVGKVEDGPASPRVSALFRQTLVVVI